MRFGNRTRGRVIGHPSRESAAGGNRAETRGARPVRGGRRKGGEVMTDRQLPLAGTVYIANGGLVYPASFRAMVSSRGEPDGGRSFRTAVKEAMGRSRYGVIGRVEAVSDPGVEPPRVRVRFDGGPHRKRWRCSMTFTVPAAFRAEPGDRVNMALEPFGRQGG